MFTETFVKLTIHAHDFAVAISHKQFQEHARGRQGAPTAAGWEVVFLTCRFPFYYDGPMVPCQKAREAQGFTKQLHQLGVFITLKWNVLIPWLISGSITLCPTLCL